jgi:hypothetical protein
MVISWPALMSFDALISIDKSVWSRYFLFQSISKKALERQEWLNLDTFKETISVSANPEVVNPLFVNLFA